MLKYLWLHILLYAESITCLTGNGGCSQICNQEGGIPFCSCKPGYQLDSDKKSCVGKTNDSHCLELVMKRVDNFEVLSMEIQNTKIC